MQQQQQLLTQQPEASYSPNYPNAADNIDSMLLDRALDARLSSQQQSQQFLQQHKSVEQQGDVLCERSPVAVNCTNSTDVYCQDKGTTLIFF